MKKIVNERYQETRFEETLENGLHVILWQKKDYVKSMFMMVTPLGAMDMKQVDENGKEYHFPAGIAHFLEHKLFEDEQGRDVTLDFVKLGADVNAFTTLEKTTYYFSTLDHFEESLELLLKFTSSFTSSEDAVNHEKRIIEQEINMYQDDPDYRAYLG